MLPEQVLREPHRTEQELIRAEFWLYVHVADSRQDWNEKPHTLTGDEWRTAWAEAHDAQTDAALDAVY